MNPKLIKQYGELSFITGSQLATTEQMVSVSPRLDIVLGGGIPGGSFCNISGDPKCGKTLTSLCIIRNGQKLKRPCFYLNIEGRLKTRDLRGIKGLDLDKLQIIRSYRDEDEGITKVHTAEEYLQIAEWIVKNVPNAIIVLDSVSQLAAEKECDGEIGDKLRAPGAVLMAQFCRKVSNIVPINNTIIISILHLIANTSGYGKTKHASGGRKIAYACDVGLEAKRFTFKRPGSSDEEESKPPYGQEVLWQTTSTAVCAPGQQITSFIRYGIGIDEVLETLMIAVDAGFVKKSGKGAWYTLTINGKEKKIQGEEKVCNFLGDHPEVLDEITKQVREMLYG